MTASIAHDTDESRAAYFALSAAAERLAAVNYGAQLDAHRATHTTLRTFRFTVTPTHAALMRAMRHLAAGSITPDGARALLTIVEEAS